MSRNEILRKDLELQLFNQGKISFAHHSDSMESTGKLLQFFSVSKEKKEANFTTAATELLRVRKKEDSSDDEKDAKKKRILCIIQKPDQSMPLLYLKKTKSGKLEIIRTWNTIDIKVIEDVDVSMK